MKSWNDILNYIKSYFTNQEIELSDAEMLTHLQNHTIKEFSIWAPRRYRVILDRSCVVDNKLGIYEIPIPEDENFEIIDIYEWYHRINTSSDNYSSSLFDSSIGTVISVWFNDTSNTNPPIYPILDKNSSNRVVFNISSSEVEKYLPALLELKVTHTSPQTIPTEVYYRWFKPFCYADILILLGNIRSKFQQLSTPIGQIQTNAELLIQQGQQLKQQIISELSRQTTISNPLFF